MNHDVTTQLPYLRSFYFDDLEHLIATGKYWQRQLRLQDWNVRYHIRKHFDMPTEKASDGLSRIYPGMKLAYVYLLEPDDHEWKESYDMEQVLVHELLHLPFDGWMDTSKAGPLYLSQEAFIDQTATALVMLNRGARR